MMKKEKEIKNEKKVCVCQDCPAYVPGCCTVDNMPTEPEYTCKFAGVFKNLEEGKEVSNNEKSNN